jgi:NAD(P)-dependent dehydrogenase (short-subunit alcohol dehydrogenase family)
MKIIVVGGKGTIGSAVVKELSARHEVLTAGRNNCDLACDMTSEDSIRAMYAKAGKLDAVVVASGTVVFDDLEKMTSAKYHAGLSNKLMGQVAIVLIGREFIQDKGSFTLTSGILGRDPIRTGSSASMVNKAIEGFVIGAAIEMPRQLRINAICPTVLAESMDLYTPRFRGYDPVPAAKVALAYSKSVEGLQTGQIYEVLR